MGPLNSIALVVLCLCVVAWAFRNLWRAGRGETPSRDPLLNAAIIGVGVSFALWFLPGMSKDLPEEIFTGVGYSDAFWLVLFAVAGSRYSSARLREERE